MGLYDEIYIDAGIIKDYKIHCPDCKCHMSSFSPFQTKDTPFVCMQHYALKKDGDKKIKLFLLHEPNDEKYWHKYTEEEKNSHWITLGDGYWVREAYYPHNRRCSKAPTEMHQYLICYDECPSCDKLVYCKIKFTDDVVEKIETYISKVEKKETTT